MEGEGDSQRPQKWTAKEEEALLAGVVKQGVGKWKIILEDSEFGPFLSRRSNRDLKDKWRRLSSLGGTGTVRTCGNYQPGRRLSVRTWGNYKPFRAAEALKDAQTISETNEAQQFRSRPIKTPSPCYNWPVRFMNDVQDCEGLLSHGEFHNSW